MCNIYSDSLLMLLQFFFILFCEAMGEGMWTTDGFDFVEIEPYFSTFVELLKGHNYNGV